MALIKLTIFFTFFAFLTATAQKKCDYSIDTAKILLNKNLDSFLFEIKNDSFKISYNKKDIPLFIRKQLHRLTNDFSIANPGEKYQATDVIDEKLPWRQLIFLAKSKNIVVLTYRLGGFAESIHILFIKFNNNKIIDLWAGVSPIELESLSDVLHYIKVHRDKTWGLNANFVHL